MSEEQAGRAPRRRTPAEAAELVRQCDAAGVSKAEFCRSHGLPVSTLDAYRRGRRLAQSPAEGEACWVAVDLAVLVVVLAKGRRIEVGSRFHAGALERLVHLLERA